MSVAARFHAWRAVVIGTLVANVAFAATTHPSLAVASMSLLAAMLALLLTTPADAIVLPRPRSERIILAGYAAAAAIATHGEARAMLTAIVGAAIVIAALALSRGVSISAWWIAMIAWNPVALVVIRAAA